MGHKMETWKNIQGWEGIYQVSNFGRLKSFKSHPKGRILSNTNKKGGYFSVVLCYKDKRRYVRMHRLVAEAFLPNYENKPEVNHKDGNKQNNHVDNLEWVTHSENLSHSTAVNPERVEGMIFYNKVLRPKPIIQKSLSGEIIATFINSVEAHKETGVCRRNILQVASKTEYKPGKKRKQAGGYVWEFGQ